MTEQPSVEQMEQYVRARWEGLRAFKNASGGFTIDNGYKHAEIEVIRATATEAIQFVYAFTLRREQEISQVRRAIRWCNCQANAEPEAKFVLSILEAQFADLLKGFREQ